MDTNNNDNKEKEITENEEEELTEDVEVEDDVKNEVEEKLEACESKYKRALADYQNLEKRVREERVEWIKQANRDLIQRILPVLDTLMLALAHKDDQTIKVTIDQFLSVLKDEGITRIETKGKKFNPHLMECIETVSEGEDVLEEVRAGYLMHDKLLRPAQVKVGNKK